MKGKIWLVIGLALGLRLIWLDQSLWLDEAITANVVARFSLVEIVKKFSVADFHPPFYYWLLKLWVIIFGVGEVSLRMPSVIFGVVTVCLSYRLGKEIKDEKVGFWAGLMTAVNPLLIYYSQEARMYSLAVMCLTAVVYYFVKIEKGGEKKEIIWFNLFSILAVISFYGSGLMLAGMALYWLTKRKWALVIKTNLGFLGVVILLIPLLKAQFINSGRMLAEMVNWSGALGKVTIKNLLLIPVKFVIGRISFYPKKLYWGLAGLWTGVMSLVVIKGWKQGKYVRCILITPLVLGMIVSVKWPMMQYFRFLYLVPIMILLLVLGSGKRMRVVLTGGCLLWSLAYLLIPKFHRENWRGVTESLGEEVYVVESKSDPIIYYRPDVVVKDLKKGKPTEKVIEVIPYAAEIEGLDYRKRLTDFGYRQVEEKAFGGIVWQRWEF